MFEHITQDVQAALYAASVRGVVLHYANHLHLLTTYGAIADTLKVTPQGGQLAQALALITEEDVKAKQTPTTSVVVNSKTGIPGKGYFDQCRRLGVLPESHNTESLELTWWQSQLHKLNVAQLTLEQHVVQYGNDLAVQQTESQVIHRPFLTKAVLGRGDSRVTDNEIAKNLRETTTVHQPAYVWTPASHLKVGSVVLLQERRPGRPGTRSISMVDVPVTVTSVRTLNNPSGGPPLIIWVADGKEYYSNSEADHVKVSPYMNVEREAEPSSGLPAGK
jgi:hypothetical protein